jgi:hypothetical protein
MLRHARRHALIMATVVNPAQGQFVSHQLELSGVVTYQKPHVPAFRVVRRQCRLAQIRNPFRQLSLELLLAPVPMDANCLTCSITRCDTPNRTCDSKASSLMRYTRGRTLRSMSRMVSRSLRAVVK